VISKSWWQNGNDPRFLRFGYDLLFTGWITGELSGAVVPNSFPSLTLFYIRDYILFLVQLLFSAIYLPRIQARARNYQKLLCILDLKMISALFADTTHFSGIPLKQDRALGPVSDGKSNIIKPNHLAV
jgi:hypothetical protein